MTRERELLDAVHANPDDDALRRVYGDLLAERGDPRGEFIQLQFLDDKTEEQRSRERILLARYAKEWVRDLGPAISLRRGLVFERGFLARCVVRGSWNEASHLVGHPMLSTVRALSFAARVGFRFGLARRPRARHPAVHLVTDPVMRALRDVQRVGLLDVALDLAEWPTPLAIESLGVVESLEWGAALDDEWADLLARAPGLPRLRRLAWTTAASATARPFFAHGLLAERLEELTLLVQPGTFPGWIDAIEPSPVPLLTFASDFEDDLSDFGWRLTLRRGPSRRFESLTARRVFGPGPDDEFERASDLASLLGATGRSFSPIAVALPPDDDLRRALAPFGEVTYRQR